MLKCGGPWLCWDRSLNRAQDKEEQDPNRRWEVPDIVGGPVPIDSRPLLKLSALRSGEVVSCRTSKWPE